MLFPEIRRLIFCCLDYQNGNRHYPDRLSNQAGCVSRDRSDDAGAESALPSMLCLSRRRCTEEGMRMASRYLATVRRAISIPDPRNRSTMVSSDNIAVG